MSKQYDSFMEELKQLMEKHNVVIYASAYDMLEVWDITRFEDVATSLQSFSDETVGN